MLNNGKSPLLPRCRGGRDRLAASFSRSPGMTVAWTGNTGAKTRELMRVRSLACLPMPFTRTVLQLPVDERNTNGAIPLAQKIQMLFVDDIDGGEAEGTVRFGLDGVGYEIDLSVAHSEELNKALAPYIAHARKAGARRAARGRSGNSSGIDTHKVREWAGARASRSRTAAGSRRTSWRNTARQPDSKPARRSQHQVSGAT